MCIIAINDLNTLFSSYDGDLFKLPMNEEDFMKMVNLSEVSKSYS